MQRVLALGAGVAEGGEEAAELGALVTLDEDLTVLGRATDTTTLAQETAELC